MAAVPLQAAPKIRFEQNAVIAEKVTPGGETTWLAVTHEPQAYHMRVREHARVLRDDDRDGVVRFEMTREIAPESVWVVVDMTTGDWTVREPGHGKTRVKPLKHAPKITRRKNGEPASLVQTDPHVKFWIVRPGSGAWVKTSVDGDYGDADGMANGESASMLAAFTPVGSSPAPPDDLQRGDVVIVVDPFTLAIHELRVRDEEGK